LRRASLSRLVLQSTSSWVECEQRYFVTSKLTVDWHSVWPGLTYSFDSTHTTVLFSIILTFIFTVYATSPKIGSPAKMHELLASAAAARPVSGNAHGSYMTMRSKNGLIFGVINVIGNFATVFQDQAYWQRAIASKPASTVKAYLLGGLAWCGHKAFYLYVI